MKLGIYSLQAPPKSDMKSVGPLGDLDVTDVFTPVPVRGDILARVVRWQQACARSGTHASKGISAVSGTTRKPFKQKGTGKARQGSLRSPQFRGGGIIFGPQPRSHAYALPKRVRRLGLLTALSSKLSENRMGILDVCGWDKKSNINTGDVSQDSSKMVPGKSSALRPFLKSLDARVLFVTKGAPDPLFARSARNWHQVLTLPVCGLNVYDLLRFDCVFFERDALPVLKQRLKPDKEENLLAIEKTAEAISSADNARKKQVKDVAKSKVASEKKMTKARTSSDAQEVN